MRDTKVKIQLELELEQLPLRLEDFGEVSNILNTRVPDLELLTSIPDSVFAQYYLQQMESYRLSGLWGEKGNPICWNCSHDILEPKELRKYCGASLHSECFGSWYKKNRVRDESKVEKRYWERVSELRIELP